MLYFSALSNGFYDDAIHANLPADAVSITYVEHRQLLDAQAQGSIIVADPHGAPIAIERSGPSHDEAMADLRDRRDRLLASSDFSQIPDAPLTDDDRQMWRTYRQALRDLPDHVTDPATVTWPIAPSLW